LGERVTRKLLLVLAAALLVIMTVSCWSEGASRHQVRRFVVKAPVGDSYIEENVYLIFDAHTRQGLIIDPGARSSDLETDIRTEDVHVAAILNTHGHPDHVSANGFYRSAYRVPVFADFSDAALYRQSGLGFHPDNVPTDDLSRRDDLRFNGLEVRVIPTPGHTPGSVCFLVGDVLLSGDTLFRDSVGKADDDAAASELVTGIKDNLLVLPGNTPVYPGHGESTTIGTERAQNPFLQPR
jgi:hydroxyacylglutathione hydrolase